MPTGYTAPIINEGITFKQYALSCARAFGALLPMRDEPSNAPIPDEFKASDYHEKELVKAKKELTDYMLLDEDALLKLYEYEQQKEIEQHNKWNAQKDEQRAKYEAMLLEAEAYIAPSEDHVGYREFMIKQIKESIDFDCTHFEAPERLSFIDWKSKYLKHLHWAVEYHAKCNDEEVQRTRDRNKWIKQLKESLAKYN